MGPRRTACSVCDLAVAHHSPLALWPGGGEAICPTGGIVNTVIMQCLHAQFAHEMCRRDQPPIWRMGIYRTRGREFNSFADWLLESRGF